jgi:hypothetical protein
MMSMKILIMLAAVCPVINLSLLYWLLKEGPLVVRTCRGEYPLEGPCL